MPQPNHVVDVEELPSPVRTALAYALTRKDRPPALAKKKADLAILGVFLGVGVLIYALVGGFGEPDSAGQDPGLIILYVVGFGSIAWGLIARSNNKKLRELLRFQPGIYVVGSRLVDARTRKFRLFNLLDDRPAIVHHHVNGSYRYTTITWHGFQFTVGRQAAAGAALDVVRNDLEALSKAAEENDIDRILVIDPLAIGVAMAAAEKEQALKRLDKPAAKPAPSKMPVVIAIAATAVLSPGAWFARNHFSIEAAYDKIDSVYEVDDWVRTGGDAARGEQKRMELELGQAARSSNAKEIRDFIAKYPKAPAGLKGPAEAALKARYDETRKSALEASGSTELTWYINQVYDRLQSGGSPIMAITVARTDNTALESLDAVVAKDKKLSKRIVPVGKYFANDDEGGRIESVKASIRTGLEKFFPSDVLEFADAATAADAPAIEIFYVIRPQFMEDGNVSLYTELDKKGDPIPGALEYPAIEFELGAALKVPGAPAPKQVTFTAAPAPTISVYSSPGGEFDDDPTTSLDNSAVYHAMAESAFTDLQAKLVPALGGVAPPDPAAEGDGSGGSALDTVPECAEMKTALREYTTCDKISEAERTSMTEVMKGLDSSGGTEVTDLCKRGAALLRESMKLAGCP